MKSKIVIFSCLALLGLTGVAKAAGLVGHEGSGLDSAAKRVQALESELRRPDAAATDSRARRGPRGPRGPRGATGAKGATGATGATGAIGPKGTFGTITSVFSAPAFLCTFEFSCAVGSARAECPAGSTVIGGGYSGAGILTTVTYDAPSGNGWGIVAINFSEEFNVTNLRAVAQCATG